MVNNNLTQAKKKTGLTAYLTQDAVKTQINNIIGGKDGSRFISSIVSAVSTNPALQECTNNSIVSGALLGESLKLSPSPQLGHYYLVPFNNRQQGTKEAQFQLGYKGYIQLAIRSGQYKKLNVMAIKAGELIAFNPLDEEIEINLIKDFNERENAETIGYYAFFELTNGFRKAIYWSKEQMEAHATKYSMGYKVHKGYTFWEKNFDGMAYKTMLRQLISKWGIMSIDMMKAFDGDMAVMDGESPNYVDDQPDEFPETKEEVKVEATEAQAEETTEPSAAQALFS